MILSFYLPAMVFIVLTALATCVFVESERGEKKREKRGKTEACFFFVLRCIRLDFLEPRLRREKTQTKKKQPPRLRSAARPAPRAGHRARGLDHVGFDRRFSPS